MSNIESVPNSMYCLLRNYIMWALTCQAVAQLMSIYRYQTRPVVVLYTVATWLLFIMSCI